MPYDNIEFVQTPDCTDTLAVNSSPTISDLEYSADSLAPDFGGAIDLLFTNSKPTLCPVTECLIFAAGCSGLAVRTTIL